MILLHFDEYRFRQCCAAKCRHSSERCLPECHSAERHSSRCCGAVLTFTLFRNSILFAAILRLENSQTTPCQLQTIQ
jgi:hypothetical protein